jgi:HSP20 family protein
VSTLDLLFDDLHHRLRELALELESGSETLGRSFRPAIDVLIDEGAVEIQAEVPGIDVSTLELRLAPDRLIIGGTKSIEPPTRECRSQHHRLERLQGKFERTISLPGSLDSSRADASLENGILKIVIPRLEERRHELRHVPIQAIEEPTT